MKEQLSIEVHNLTVSYDKLPVLWELDFELPASKIIGVIGPNGSGKSTLIKTIMGIMKPSSGYVKIFNDSFKNVRSRIAYVPQRESVDWDFPATVEDVVKMGRYTPQNILRRLTATDKEIVKNALEKVGMLSFRKRHISQLSGGQQQRVFIARALAQQADLYIMDEPFVGVDAATEKAILKLLEEMRDQGKTVLIVHHDLQTVFSYFDHIVLINTRLVSEGPIKEVLTAQNLNEAYGGQLNALSQITHLVKQNDYPVREKGSETK